MTGAPRPRSRRWLRARAGAPGDMRARDGGRRTMPARVEATLALFGLCLLLAACGGGASPSEAQAGGSAAPASVTASGASAAASPAAAVGSSPEASACATPVPLAPVGVCTAPSPGADASSGAGSASAAPAGSVPPAASGAPAATTSPPASAVPSPSTSGSAPGAGTAPAPTSAVGFRVRDTVVPMAFPLRASAAYRYGDGWRASRVGVVRPYEQIRGVAPDGSYLRAHDGIDLLVKLGTPVYAPWSGTVIDPAKRWKPWDPSRYGKVVAIESDEPTSPGYFVLLAHLSKQSVKVGDHVERGQVVGKTGDTGNAVGTKPHLHLEIRAPFLIRYGYAGVIRRLDVFDAEPSVRAADPKAS